MKSCFLFQAARGGFAICCAELIDKTLFFMPLTLMRFLSRSGTKATTSLLLEEKGVPRSLIFAREQQGCKAGGYHD